MNTYIFLEKFQCSGIFSARQTFTETKAFKNTNRNAEKITRIFIKYFEKYIFTSDLDILKTVE